MERAVYHWQSYGLPDGRRGSAELDPVWYSQADPDVAEVHGGYGHLGAAYHWIEAMTAGGRPGAP
jgi:hypothetical protein